MTPLLAAILGLVEGLTEYLPVSSTGHLIVVSRWLGLRGQGADAFDVVIQLGAILAVVIHYRRLLVARAKGLASRRPESLALFAGLLLGFAPAALLGFAFRRAIKTHLFGVTPVALALIVGGVLMAAVDARVKERTTDPMKHPPCGLEHVTPRRALLIGLGQCFALWPGASRSMCTIVAGQLSGLSTKTAAEFSFLLGLPTLGAATVYEAVKSREALMHLGIDNVAIGLVVSFTVAWVVIAGFITYLQKRGLMIFGIYRVVLGLVLLGLSGAH